MRLHHEDLSNMISKNTVKGTDFQNMSQLISILNYNDDI